MPCTAHPSHAQQSRAMLSSFEPPTASCAMHSPDQLCLAEMSCA